MVWRSRALCGILFVAIVGASSTAAQREPLRVLVYDAPGVGASAIDSAMAAFTAAEGVEARRVTPADIEAGALDDADVALFTGGRGSVQGRLLGESGRERVREFVRRGGGYLGICAGSYLALQGEPEFYKVAIVAARNLTGDRWRRGTRSVSVRPTDGSDAVTLHYANGPLIAPDSVEGLAPFVSLATFDADVHWERYDTHAGEMPGTVAVAAARFGRGRMILFSPNPTLEPGRPELLLRAMRWVATTGPVAPGLRWRDVFGSR